ncbi:MAG: PAS domain S-box protein, partial [Chloroflexi bacterium]|nr:PAS domain S-box protein [Chloroflexota bacterium]
MQDNRKTKTELLEELVALRRRVAKLESQPRSAPTPDSRVETPRDSEKRFQTFAGIAEREQAEVALRDSEARLRSLLENAPVRITALDRQGRFLALSHPLEHDDTGADDGPSIFTFLEPDEQVKVRRVLDQVFEQGVAAQYAGSIRLPTGDAAYFTHVAGPVWRDGQVVEAVVVSLDMTEQKHMEAVLRASEQRYKTLIENQGEGLGLVDANENFIFANPAAGDLFGQTDGLMGHHLSEYLEADQFEVIQRETIVRQQGQKSTY